MYSAEVVQEALQRKQEPWRWGVQWLAMGSWQQGTERIIKADPLTKKLPKNSMSTILWSFSIWCKLERWKISVSGCLMSWLKIKNIVILKWLLLFYATTKNHFSIGLWCTMKSALYTTTDDDPLNAWTEKKLQSTSQSQICTQKGHGHCLVVCCPSDPLKLSESQWNHYIWEVCSANQWVTLKTIMPAASIGQHKGPNASAPQCSTTHCTTSTSKVEWIGLPIFAIFTWPPANRLPLLQTFQQLFARKMLPQPAGGRKCFPRVHWIVKHRFLCCRNKQTYFSLAKNVLIVMVPI